METIRLSNRLQAVASWIAPCGTVADVGTDHGYLSVWLLQTHTAQRVIASDIHAGPLDRARRSAAEYSLENAIRFELCDGLQFAGADAADTVVIAGMGGETIIAILEGAAWTKDGAHTLFWASNFSIGVAIFSAVNKYLAKIMNGFPQYDVRMEETHHIHKLDAPSGTAITLAEELIDNLDRKNKWEKGLQIAPDGTASGSNEVEADSLAIESIRRDEVPGIHSIIYDSEADQITITHDAHSRRGFALGAVLAAEYTYNHEGLLTTSDLFKF